MPAHIVPPALRPGECQGRFTDSLQTASVPGRCTEPSITPFASPRPSPEGGRPGSSLATGTSALTHLMKISSNWSVLITPRNAMCNYHGSSEAGREEALPV